MELSKSTLDGTTTVDITLDRHVLTVTLNRPERLNSFNQVMLDEFSAIWSFADSDDDVHAIVLRAAGERAFSTGVDVTDGFDMPANPFSQRDPGHSLSPKQNACWKPVICAVHGMVAGGALYWLNEADVIIASEDAQFFDPHVSYGMVAALEPIGLARRIPLGEVLRLTLLGLDERMSVQRAHQIGLVSEVVAREALWERADQLAQRIAANPPAAVQGSVRAIWESLDSTRSQALATAMPYILVGNPIGMAQVDRTSTKRPDYEVR